MSETLNHVLNLVEQGEVKIPDHGYDELAADNIYVRNIVAGSTDAVAVEDYPEYPKVHVCGSCKRIGMASLSTLSGEFRRTLLPRQFSLRLTGLIRSNGPMIF